MRLLWNISFTNKLLIILFWVAALPLAIFVGLDVLFILLGYMEEFAVWCTSTAILGIVLWVKRNKLEITGTVITRAVVTKEVK